MTPTPKERAQATEPQYIIRTSMGLFFLMWEDFSTHPEMTANRAAARKLESAEADYVLDKMTRKGIKAKKVEAIGWIDG